MWELFGLCKANVRRTFGEHRPDNNRTPNRTLTEQPPNTQAILAAARCRTELRPLIFELKRLGWIEAEPGLLDLRGRLLAFRKRLVNRSS